MNTFKNFFKNARNVFVYDHDEEGRGKGKAAAKKDGRAVKKEDEAPPQKTPKTRIVSLQDLQKKSKAMKVDQFEKLIAPGEELKLAFESIFDKANIRPPRAEQTIDWTADFVEMKECGDMQPDDIRQMLLTSLKASRVKPEDILQDAVNRDLAMDNYEPFLLTRTTRAAEVLQDEIVDSEKAINELQEKIAGNRKKIADVKSFFEDFKKRKIEKETRMAKAARYLTADEHLVSIGSTTDGQQQADRGHP